MFTEVAMGEMKSALERAMERAEKLGKPSDEDLMRWKYVPEGEALGARFLRDECDLGAELRKYDDSVRKYVVDGVVQVLARNLGLPRNEVAKKLNKKAMEAIKDLKRDKVGVENTYSKLRRVFNHYLHEGEQQRKQAYEALKIDVEQKMRQAMKKEMGASAASVRINIEAQPQFQQEWRRVLSQLESQYSKLLEEYKQELLKAS